MKTDVRKTSKNSDAGFGLIEAIIAAAILSIVALGITTLVEDMLRVQKKSTAVGAINNFRSLITSAVQNGKSWELTVNDSENLTSMGCMHGGADCNNNNEFPLKLLDVNSSVVYNAITAGSGFNYDGQTCATYPSDACPLRWVLTWKVLCPNSAATCQDPNVRVLGSLEYSPGAAGALPGGFNPKLYLIDILRGADAIRNDAVLLSYINPTGEGICNTGWVRRKLNTVVSDPADNLVNKSGNAVSPADQFTLKAGTYNCRIQSPAFKSGGNRLQLIKQGFPLNPVANSPSANAAVSGGSANLLIETTLILSVATTFEIQQICTKKPSDDADGYGSVDDTWSLGVPVPGSSGDYTTTVFTTVSCARTS